MTRRSGDLPEEGDERHLHQSEVVLKRGRMDPQIGSNVNPKLRLLSESFSHEPAGVDATLFENLRQEGIAADNFP